MRVHCLLASRRSEDGKIAKLGVGCSHPPSSTMLRGSSVASVKNKEDPVIVSLVVCHQFNALTVGCHVHRVKAKQNQ